MYFDCSVSINRPPSAVFAMMTDIQDYGKQERAALVPVMEKVTPGPTRGDFPHKTAATRAGLGWIGSNCQLVTAAFGPWVRLGTVFMNAEFPCGPPAERNFCGRCLRCVKACPAQALKKGRWYPGMPREDMLDVRACDQWKKEHFFQYNRGHNCGICSAVCPYGLKILRRSD